MGWVDEEEGVDAGVGVLPVRGFAGAEGRTGEERAK